jgi:hypothetical protein
MRDRHANDHERSSLKRSPSLGDRYQQYTSEFVEDKSALKRSPSLGDNSSRYSSGRVKIHVYWPKKAIMSTLNGTFRQMAQISDMSRFHEQALQNLCAGS